MNLRLNQAVSDPTLQRKLEGQSEHARSSCFCPLDSTINELAPPKEVVQNQLSVSAKEVEPSYDVGDIAEVEAVECAVDISDFQTEMSIDMTADRKAIQSVVTQLADLIKDTYNDLTLLYCDSLFRRVATVEVEEFELDQALDQTIFKESDCGLFRATFKLQGQCRGCTNGTSLLDLEEDTGRNRRRNNRRALEAKDLNRLQERRLERSFFDQFQYEGFGHRNLQQEQGESSSTEEQISYCFCGTDTIAERAPSEAEFFAALEEAIAESAVGSAVCDFYGIMEDGRTTPPSSCKMGKNPCRLATNLYAGLDSCNDDRSCANSDGLLAADNACVGVQSCRSTEDLVRMLTTSSFEA